MSPTLYDFFKYIDVFLILYFFFNFSASERGDSPWCSSLNHSYETLNMPDSASDHEPSLGKKCALKKKDKFMSDRILPRDFDYYFCTFYYIAATPLRNPHRPAPPVPASASPLVKRKENNMTADLDVIEVASAADSISLNR